MSKRLTKGGGLENDVGLKIKEGESGISACAFSLGNWPDTAYVCNKFRSLYGVLVV